MSDTKMGDIIRASMDGIKSFTGLDTVVGGAINTPAGVTVIPVSRVSMAIATGGIDYGTKKINELQNFGGGGGSGVSITPIAFLTINKDAEIKLIHLNDEPSDVARITDIIEKAPDIFDKIKGLMS